ncbi:hypothetical protein YN1_0350 [Nanoarchaeota archaeon]
MKKRYQTFAVGLFFIVLGIILLIYWLLLSTPAKQQFLQQILNQTLEQNITSITTPVSQYTYQNIQLSSSSSYYYIANNYTIGNYVPTYIQPVGDIDFRTNIFYGIVEKSYYFYFSNNYVGINITGFFYCSNGHLDIYVNNYKLYSGCQNGELSIFVPSYYLYQGENKLEISFVPNNVFFSGVGQVNNLNLYYLELSYLSFSYYYVSGDVYLYYDFCPYSPQNVQLVINNLTIPLSECSDLFYLTPYLNIGENNIQFESSYPVELNNVYIQSNNNIFYIPFSNNITNDLLEVVVNQGSGEISINNNCRYIINSEQAVYAINISECLLPTNILAIRPINYLDISYLQIS